MTTNAIRRPTATARRLSVQTERPPVVGRLRHRKDEQCEPGRDGDRTRDVQRLPPRGAALVHEARREDEGQRADRDVDEEDPLPAEVGRQDAAQQDADRGAAAAQRSPDAECLVALGALLERGHHDRERGRRDHRGPDTLNRTRRDEDALRPGEPAEERGEREDDDADHEHAPAPVQVGEAAGEQEEAAVRDRVRRDHPLQVVSREVQRRADRRQGHVDDRDVQDRHEERGTDHRERLPTERIGLSHRRRCSFHRTLLPCGLGESYEETPIQAAALSGTLGP